MTSEAELGKLQFKCLYITYWGTNLDITQKSVKIAVSYLDYL